MSIKLHIPKEIYESDKACGDLHENERPLNDIVAAEVPPKLSCAESNAPIICARASPPIMVDKLKFCSVASALLIIYPLRFLGVDNVVCS